MSSKRRLVKGLVALVMVMLLIEAGARLVLSVGADVRALGRTAAPEWFELSADSGWEPRPGWHGEVYGSVRSFPVPEGVTGVFRAEGAAGRGRVLFLGDSNTFGIRVEANRTFPARLAELLPGVEMVSAGVPGHTAVQGALRLERLLARIPADVVVIGYGYNDRRYVLDPAMADDPAWFAEMAARERRAGMGRGLHRLGTARLLAGVMQRLGLLPAELKRRQLPPPPDSLEQLTARVPLPAYVSALERMVAASRSRGAVPVLLAFHDSPEQTDDLKRGMAELQAGRPTEAAHTLRRVVGRRDMYMTLARLHLGRAWRQLGDTDRAAMALALDEPLRSLHGGAPIHPDQLYLEALGRVARQLDAALVEVGAALDQAPWVYTDFCHFDQEGHELVARQLSGVIARQLAPEIGPASEGAAAGTTAAGP